MSWQPLVWADCSFRSAVISCRHWVQHVQWCHSKIGINVGQRHVLHLTLALTVSKILTFQKFDFENVCLGHRVQHSQCCHSVITSNRTHNTLAITISDILRFEMFDLERFCQGYGVQHSLRSYSMANINDSTSINVIKIKQFSLSPFFRY